MKCLTIRQPWCHCIVHEQKTAENRSWKTNYRGPLLIHAGQRLDNAARSIIEAQHHIVIPDDLPTGGIIGIVDLVDVVENSSSPWAEPDQYHWILARPRPLPFTPAKGKLGLWNHEIAA
jgi:hypothetical protein